MMGWQDLLFSSEEIVRHGSAPIATYWASPHSVPVPTQFSFRHDLHHWLILDSATVVHRALSQTMTQVKESSHTQEVRGQQQNSMDQTRMEIMNASDKLNRAGICLLYDKESRSVGCWQSLMEEAETSLKLSKSHYRQLMDVVPSDQRDAVFSELTAHYRQLYDGLV
ncbi:Tar ligand binding domain-containing protein [Lonsdalea iberica]|uniref:Tar ligand binding domain-containing protein n=1 Tax=Lonsdalea iberica TaxID=1082703 RepID=UPI001F0B2D13|nr:Tar ligand binding domain-containing protein [Lonsdalea iberica]